MHMTDRDIVVEQEYHCTVPLHKILKVTTRKLFAKSTHYIPANSLIFPDPISQLRADAIQNATVIDLRYCAALGNDLNVRKVIQIESQLHSIATHMHARLSFQHSHRELCCSPIRKSWVLLVNTNHLDQCRLQILQTDISDTTYAERWQAKIHRKPLCKSECGLKQAGSD
jgi:hypothetical protein